MPYTRPYTGGFKDYPDTTTPINATALNTMDVGIKTANDQFQTVTTAQRTALSPTVGQAVWDSDLKQLMVYMNASGGNAWQPVGNRIVCASTTRPSTPFHGQVIYETDTKKEYTYNGTAWVQTNTASTTSGVTGVSNLIVPPMAKVMRTSDTAYTSTTSITWQSVASADKGYDTDSMWAAGDPTKLTFNTAGVYSIVFQWFLSGTSLSNCLGFIQVNNSFTLAEFDVAPPTSTQALSVVTAMYNATAGDYIQGRIQYTGTGTIKGTTVASYLAATWVGRTS